MARERLRQNQSSEESSEIEGGWTLSAALDAMVTDANVCPPARDGESHGWLELLQLLHGN